MNFEICAALDEHKFGSAQTDVCSKSSVEEEPKTRNGRETVSRQRAPEVISPSTWTNLTLIGVLHSPFTLRPTMNIFVKASHLQSSYDLETVWPVLNI